MALPPAITTALDLARMPALAQSIAFPPIPRDILELIRIAARSPDACKRAQEATGESEEVLVQAARFYLQQALLRPEADAYRTLGLQPNSPRSVARLHLRWLLEWLHPDRNRGAWESVYAERVLKAWHHISANAAVPHPPPPANGRPRPGGMKGMNGSIRVPWIMDVVGPKKKTQPSFTHRSLVLRALMLAAMSLFFLLLTLAIPAAGSDERFCCVQGGANLPTT